jgi:hypothetical protein
MSLLTEDYNNMTAMTTLTRLCIKCGEDHPIRDFPAGVFRFECRKHVWRRAKQDGFPDIQTLDQGDLPSTNDSNTLHPGGRGSVKDGFPDIQTLDQGDLPSTNDSNTLHPGGRGSVKDGFPDIQTLADTILFY